jgi:hypothetical protein
VTAGMVTWRQPPRRCPLCWAPVPPGGPGLCPQLTPQLCSCQEQAPAELQGNRVPNAKNHRSLRLERRHQLCLAENLRPRRNSQAEAEATGHISVKEENQPEEAEENPIHGEESDMLTI